MTLKQLQAGLLFYVYFKTLPLFITILCCYFYYSGGGDLFAAIGCKIATSIAILYLISTLYGQRLYYYYNLHISKNLLMITFLTFDTLILVMSLCITSLIR